MKTSVIIVVMVEYSLHTHQVAHQAGAYPSSMKQLGVFLLSPAWDASPLQH